MFPFLTIPWFKAEPIYIPFPFKILGMESLPLQPFGMLVAIGVLLGIRIAEEFARRNGVKPEVSTDYATHVVGFGFLGALFLNAVFYNQAWFAETAENIAGWFEGRFKISAPGLSSYGGFFGAGFGNWVFKQRRKMPVMSIIDASSFGFVFGWIFGRMGCFVVHDHPGKVSDFFLAVADYQTHGAVPPYPPRHDLGLYEVIWAIAVSALFLFLARKPRKGGTYFSLLIMLYAPVRFCLDFLRAPGSEGGDDRTFGLTAGQYASVVVLIIGSIMLRKILTEPAAEIPPAARLVPEVPAPSTGRMDETPTVAERPAAGKKPKKKR